MNKVGGDPVECSTWSRIPLWRAPS